MYIPDCHALLKNQGKGIFTARKRSLGLANIYRPQRCCGQGNVFTRVCDSVHRAGVCPQCMLGYHHPLGPGTPPRTMLPRDQALPLDQAAPGTRHPLAYRSMSSHYASYWNTFLFQKACVKNSVWGWCLVQRGVWTCGVWSRGAWSGGYLVHGGCLVGAGGSAPREGVCSQGEWRPLLSGQLLLRAVRILPECILVCNNIVLCDSNVKLATQCALSKNIFT